MRRTSSSLLRARPCQHLVVRSRARRTASWLPRPGGQPGKCSQAVAVLQSLGSRAHGSLGSRAHGRLHLLGSRLLQPGSPLLCRPLSHLRSGGRSTLLLCRHRHHHHHRHHLGSGRETAQQQSRPNLLQLQGPRAARAARAVPKAKPAGAAASAALQPHFALHA